MENPYAGMIAQHLEELCYILQFGLFRHGAFYAPDHFRMKTGCLALIGFDVIHGLNPEHMKQYSYLKVEDRQVNCKL
jgi:hypothetical protein